MPNTDRIRTWVAALRSGDYRQTQGALSTPDEDSFCCFGVACKVFQFALTDHLRTYEEVLQELGLLRSEASHLIQLNDELEQSFDQIAGYLEQTYLT